MLMQLKFTLLEKMQGTMIKLLAFVPAIHCQNAQCGGVQKDSTNKSSAPALTPHTSEEFDCFEF